MKMGARGIVKVGRSLAKMGSDVDGRGWVDSPKMDPQSEKKRLEGMLKEIRGGKHGKKCFIKMNGGRIERSAEKQAKPGTENAGWYEKWWEKYDAKGWTEHYDGRGSVLKCKVHKYGKSTTGESWDIVVNEGTYYEAEPHYGWADVVGDSTQLLSIEPLERPPGVYPNPPPPPPVNDASDLPSSS